MSQSSPLKRCLIGTFELIVSQVLKLEDTDAVFLDVTVPVGKKGIITQIYTKQTWYMWQNRYPVKNTKPLKPSVVTQLVFQLMNNIAGVFLCEGSHRRITYLTPFKVACCRILCFPLAWSPVLQISHLAASRAHHGGTTSVHPPLKINSEFTPEKWWLEEYFPFGKVNFRGLC